VPGLQLQQQQGAGPSTSQTSEAHELEGLRGFIAAGSLGPGDVLSFAFSIAPAEVRLVSGAQPSSSSAPEDAHPQRQGMPGRHRLHVEQLSGHGRQQSRAWQAPGDGNAANAGGGDGQQGSFSFSWVPCGLAAARSLGLQRRICWPLQQPGRCAKLCT
jgi:hypothetical protein